MFEKAAEVAERIAKARPLDPTAHLHAGMYRLLYTGEAQRARVHFLEALRLRPGWAEAQSFLKRMETEMEA
jgi:Flp pilus assembly protein TadD